MVEEDSFEIWWRFSGPISRPLRTDVMGLVVKNSKGGVIRFGGRFGEIERIG